MFGSLKISSKITLTNIVLLVLMLLLGATSVYNLQENLRTFDGYRELTNQTNTASEVQAKMLQAELAVRDYILRPSEEGQAGVLQSLDNVRGLTQDPEDTNITEKDSSNSFLAVQGSLASFSNVFSQVTQKQAERDSLVTIDLSSIGSNIESNLFALMDSISLDGDADLTFMAGESLRDFLVTQNSVQTFIFQNDEASYAESTKRFAKFFKRFGKLLKNIDNKKLKAIATKVERDAVKYQEILAQTKIVIEDRNKLLSDDLLASSDDVELVISGLKDEVLTHQQSLGVQAEKVVTDATNLAAVLLLVSAVIAVGLAISLSRGIARPIVGMTDAMSELSKGNLDTDIPGNKKRDEIGHMAKAVQIFKDNAIRVKEMEDQREKSRIRAEGEKKAMLNSLANDFELKIGSIVDGVSSQSDDMYTTAQSLSDIASQTSEQALNVATSARETSQNTQAVASAAGQLSASIQEISEQVAQSSMVSANAVTEVNVAGRLVSQLENSAERVGDIIQLITDIAEQTNLLALNATIEAARAGDAGKGFAVVANEVKSLSNQTSKATDDISLQIGEIQGATNEVVNAIKGISNAIGELDSISTTIAAAVEEQGAATGEIARNVDIVSEGTSNVSLIIENVSDAANNSGDATSHALETAKQLSNKASDLKKEISEFLVGIRAA